MNHEMFLHGEDFSFSEICLQQTSVENTSFGYAGCVNGFVCRELVRHFRADKASLIYKQWK
jgi:hypothetical protein